MARRSQIRGVKVCAQCGGGYDAFKAMELRGRYCSPGCLERARASHRHLDVAMPGGTDVAAPLSQ